MLDGLHLLSRIACEQPPLPPLTRGKYIHAFIQGLHGRRKGGGKVPSTPPRHCYIRTFTTLSVLHYLLDFFFLRLDWLQKKGLEMWNSENVCFKIIALFCTFIHLFLMKLSFLKELWAHLWILQKKINLKWPCKRSFSYN